MHPHEPAADRTDAPPPARGGRVGAGTTAGTVLWWCTDGTNGASGRQPQRAAVSARAIAVARAAPPQQHETGRTRRPVAVAVVGSNRVGLGVCMRCAVCCASDRGVLYRPVSSRRLCDALLRRRRPSAASYPSVCTLRRWCMLVHGARCIVSRCTVHVALLYDAQCTLQLLQRHQPPPVLLEETGTAAPSSGIGSSLRPHLYCTVLYCARPRTPPRTHALTHALTARQCGPARARRRQFATCFVDRLAASVLSHAAWYPTRHDIPRGKVSHAAKYPTRHGNPRGMVSHRGVAAASCEPRAEGDSRLDGPCISVHTQLHAHARMRMHAHKKDARRAGRRARQG